jgi:DNA modification methylase
MRFRKKPVVVEAVQWFKNGDERMTLARGPMTPAYEESRVVLYHAECVEAMASMPEASVDAIVTDPPYDLISVSRNGSGRSNEPENPYGRHGSHGGGFMGLKWDSTGVAFKVETWAAALRVLKPGGHVLAFGGTRTFHRLTSALEDAGFEIRDCLMWLYGSGFPKSLDVSKAIDKAAGVQGEVIGTERVDVGMQGGHMHSGREHRVVEREVRAPASDDARRWQGWGTALKPAWEPIVLARKPLGEANVAANVLRHGTGAINVDGARINPGELVPGGGNGQAHNGGRFGAHETAGERPIVQPHNLGRWPANVVLDEDAARQLDEQSGESESRVGGPREGKAGNGWRMTHSGAEYSDRGGASRFFYTAKADREDRDGSKHPTVKPTDLMAYLVRLITPPGGTVLDPFMGSGSTIWAVREYGFRAIGIDREAQYVDDAARRLRQQVLL